MSKQPPGKKKVSTNKPLRADATPPIENAPKTNSDDEGIIKAIPFYVMALGNFSVALWLLWQITQQAGGGDAGAIATVFCVYASAIFLVLSIVTALLSWGIAKSKNYGPRLLLGLFITLAPWLLLLFLFLK